MAATSSYIGANPLMVSSGWTEALLAKGMFKIQRLYWEQPDISSTSSLIITKRTGTSPTTYAHLKVEVSGQSQQLNLGDQWWQDPYIKCMPSGVLWIYLDQ
jgi:hypothetical protein